MTSEPASKSNRNTKNLLEWTVFFLSGLLVLGVIGYLIHSAAFGKSGPASVSIKVGEVREAGSATIVTLLLSNEGARTAAEVAVAVTAKFPAAEKESTMVIDFIPKGGRREAIAVFSEPGKPTEIKPRVLGYIEP